MDSKDSKYVLKNLTSEDSRTITYLAEDLILKRPVIFVQLKVSASEKEGRAFLLHARMLGQLQHPGLLPLHDMGLHEESYFYAYRIPPGKSLIDLIRQCNNGSTIYKAKSRNLIYLMSQIADTLAYLHINRVTIGRLSSESIYIGNFGEVIIKDFSKAQKFDSDDIEGFEQARTADLQSLAYLSMRVWFLSPEKEHYSIREWDQISHSLPLDLSEVLDKACLERGGRYKNTQDFHKDLLNILQDRPPSFHEGDIVFTLKGRYQKNKHACMIFLLLSLIFLITLALNNVPLGDLKKRIRQHNLSIQSLNQDLTQLDEELKSEAGKKNGLQEINTNIAAKQKKYTDEVKALEKTQAELNNNIALKNKALNAKNEMVIGLSEQEVLLKQKKQSLLDTIQKLKLTPNKQDNSYNFGPSFQEAGDFVCEQSKPRKALEQLDLNVNEGSGDWFSNYLKKNGLAMNCLASYPMAKKDSPDNVILHPSGGIIAWTADRQFFYFKITNEASLTSYYSTEQLKGLAFNGDRQFFSLNLGKIQRWNLSDRGLEKNTSSDSLGKEVSYILNNLKTSDTWTGLGKTNGILGLETVFSNSRCAKSDDLQRDSYDNIWAMLDHKLILLPLGQIMLNCPSDVEFWKVHPNGGLSIYNQGHLDIYRLKIVSEQTKFLEKIWEADLHLTTKDSLVSSIVLDDLQNRAWLSFGQNQTYLLDCTQRDSKSLDGIVGQVLTYYNNTLVTRDSMNLFCYSMSSPQISLSQGLTDSQGTLNRGDHRDDWMKKLDINLFWENPNSNYLIAIRDQHFVEVWNKKDQTRTVRMAVSPTDLTTIFYSPQYNSIIGGDADGNIYSW